MNPVIDSPYYGYENLRTDMVPVTVTGVTSGVKLTIDASKSGITEKSQIVGMSLVDYVANGTTLDIADAPAALADLTIINGAVVFLKNGSTTIHKFPLSDLIKRQADEPFLRFPLSINFDLYNKKCYIVVSASDANVAANTGKVIGLVVRYLDPNCPV